MNRFISVFFLLFACVTIGFSQTNVSVFYTDNSSESYLLTESGKLYFSGDNLLIDNATSQPITIAMDDVRKLTFTALKTTDAKSVSAEANIYVYPNPAENEIAIKGLNQESIDITIYSSLGTKVWEQTYEQGSHIDVSSLPVGLYFIKINNSVFIFNKL